MWIRSSTSRPTLQIDVGTMNIYARNLPSAGDDAVGAPAGGATATEGARFALSGGGPGLRVGFAACFPTRVEDRYTEHWVLFPSFRSPRVAYESGQPRPVNPLTLESAEPEDVLPGGWRTEGEFLEKAREFMAKHPGCRYIRHHREDSLNTVP
jgi:hypothetical protein